MKFESNVLGTSVVISSGETTPIPAGDGATLHYTIVNLGGEPGSARIVYGSVSHSIPLVGNGSFSGSIDNQVLEARVTNTGSTTIQLNWE